jgi:hypothetical protein
MFTPSAFAFCRSTSTSKIGVSAVNAVKMPRSRG